MTFNGTTYNVIEYAQKYNDLEELNDETKASNNNNQVNTQTNAIN